MDKCIPFFKIKKNSDIVLYGAGNNCIICYEQLIKSSYCNLVDIVDKKPDGKVIDGVVVKQLKEIFEKSYDYILITILNEEIAHQAKAELIAQGIPKDIIFTLCDKAAPMLAEYICNTEYMTEFLGDNYENKLKYAKKPGEYYPELEALLIQNNENKEAIFINLRTLSGKLKNDNPKFILLNLMYRYEYFDKECMKQFMECMKFTEWNDDTYYGFAIDTTIMVLFHPEYLYNDFFRDRKKIYKKICEYYGLCNIEKDIQYNIVNKKIAMVVRRYTPDMITDAPSIIARNYALEFAGLGCEVKIFVLCSEVNDEYDNISLQKNYYVEKFDSCTIYSDSLLEEKGIEIEAADSKNTRLRLRNTVTEIIEYQPAFILDMSDECFPEAYSLIRYFPIINFPMRGNSYSSAADLYMFGDIDKVIKDNAIYGTMPPEKLRKVLLANLCTHSNNTTTYTRDNFGFDKDDFVIVTVGSRLHLEIDDELIENVCELLTEENLFKWILVGSNVESNNPNFNKFIREKRIIQWGYEKNLEELYSICDIYLNPIRTGGGVSIRLAMKCGIPIAMLDSYSDAKSRMRPEHIVNGGYRELMQYIQKLYNDRDLYNEVSVQTRKVMDDLLSESDGYKVLKICEEAVLSRQEQVNIYG